MNKKPESIGQPMKKTKEKTNKEEQKLESISVPEKRDRSVSEYFLSKLNDEFPHLFFTIISYSPRNEDKELAGKLFGISRGEYQVRYVRNQNVFSPIETNVQKILFRAILIDIFDPLDPEKCGLSEADQLMNYRGLNNYIERKYGDMGVSYLCHYNLKNIYDEIKGIFQDESKYKC